MATSFLPSSLVQQIRGGTAGLFWDSGVILKRVDPADTGGYSQYKAVFGDYDDKHPELEIATECKVNIRGMSEFGNWNELAEGTGSLLLPADKLASVKRQDRFKLTHKFGESLSRVFMFDILGEPRMALLGVKVDIRLIPG